MPPAWDSCEASSVAGTLSSPCRTHYTMTYYKPSNSPQLLAKHFPGNDDPHARLSFRAESLARAWFPSIL